MDFEIGARYLLTVTYAGFPGGPYETTYIGQREEGGVDVHNFLVGDGRFYLGLPDDVIGSDFLIEPL